MARSIVFAGCVRNAGPFLKEVLANCERLAATAETAFFIFAENDSTDAIKAILTEWCADNFVASAVVPSEPLLQREYHARLG